MRGEFRSVPIAEIVVSPGRREAKDVRGLADSVRECGLINPISVTTGLHLIAGRNRLEACKLLGMTEINAMVFEASGLEAQLAEIDENIVRNELTTLERAEQLARRKEIYQAIHPETKMGGDRRSQEFNKVSKRQDDALKSFDWDTAIKTGVSRRSVQREVQIANSISEPVKDLIRDTPVANDKTALLGIARQPPEMQEQAATEAIQAKDRPKRGRPKVTTSVHPSFPRASDAPAPARPSPPPVVRPSSLPVREQLANPQNFDIDVQVHAFLIPRLESMAGELREILGPISAAWRGPLHQAFHELLNCPVPSDWVVCRKCKGSMVTDKTCGHCKGSGYKIPNF